MRDDDVPLAEPPTEEECRAYTVDGVTATVRGGPTLDPETHAYLEEIVRAAIRRHRHDHPEETPDA